MGLYSGPSLLPPGPLRPSSPPALVWTGRHVLLQEEEFDGVSCISSVDRLYSASALWTRKAEVSPIIGFCDQEVLGCFGGSVLFGGCLLAADRLPSKDSFTITGVITGVTGACYHIPRDLF